MASTFLLGGARSGKSLLSEQLASLDAQRLDCGVTAVVTAEPIDDEMQDRISRHQQDRPAGWSTIEAPYGLVEAVTAIPATEIVVVDCVTVWLTNLLVRGDEIEAIEQQAQALADVIAARPSPSYVVSNEIGLGLVPGDKMSRSFRDLQGRANQALSTTLDRAVLVVAGRLLPLLSPAQALAYVPDQAQVNADYEAPQIPS